MKMVFSVRCFLTDIQFPVSHYSYAFCSLRLGWSEFCLTVCDHGLCESCLVYDRSLGWSLLMSLGSAKRHTSSLVDTVCLGSVPGLQQVNCTYLLIASFLSRKRMGHSSLQSNSRTHCENTYYPDQQQIQGYAVCSHLNKSLFSRNHGGH